MLHVEKEVQTVLKDVTFKFLGNYKDHNYDIIKHMLDKFRELGSNISLQVHFFRL
jgi:hypothetical protein